MKWNVCWLMDQKPGHLTKIKGVLKALRYHVELDIQQIPISGKHTFARKIIPRIPFLPVDLFLGKKVSPPVDLIISAGGGTEWANAQLARKYHVPNIYIGSNRVCKPTDFTILPRIGQGSLPNVLSLDFMPSEFDAEMIQKSASAELPHMTDRYWTVLIGGNGSGCIWKWEDHKKHAQELIRESIAANVKIIAASSRRTGTKAELIWKELLADSGQLALGVWYSEPNPSSRPSIAAMMGAAELIIVTEDSASMISEAVATGRRVATIKPPITQLHAIQEQMLENLSKQGRIIRIGDSYLSLREQSLQPADALNPQWHKELGLKILSRLNMIHKI